MDELQVPIKTFRRNKATEIDKVLNEYFIECAVNSAITYILK